MRENARRANSASTAARSASSIRSKLKRGLD
jgi:hypothetical protein